MKNTFRLLVFLLLVGGWGLAATSLHVVRTSQSPREFVIVPKNRLGIADTYVDTRTWTLDDVPNHKALVGRMIETEKYMAIAHVTGETEPAEVQQRLADALMRTPQPAAKVETTTAPASPTTKKKPGNERTPQTTKRKSDNKRGQIAAR